MNKKITYRYTYRGEEKEKVETLEKILSKLQTAKEPNGDLDKQPKLQFAKGENGDYTGLITTELRLRNISSEEVTRTIDLLRQLPQVALLFTDKMREVLVVVSAYTLPNGNLPKDAQEVELFHNKAYVHESLLIKGLTGRSILPGSERQDYLVTVLPDENAWLNPDIRPTMMAQPEKAVDESVLRNIVTTELPDNYDITAFRSLPGYDDYEMMMLKYQKCLSLTDNSNSGNNTDEDLDIWLTELAEHCHANGVNEEFAIKRLIIRKAFREKEVLVRECFANIYSDEKVRKENCIDKMQVVMNMLIDYMPRRYEFRRSEMSGSLEYREDGMYVFDWQPVTKEVINTITIELQRLGIPAWDKDVKRYLESNFVRNYNPITDYIQEARGKWDGKDRIAELAARVPNDNPRWAELFHRWMLSAVSQWLGRNKDYGATMAPMLVGKQGDGKSTFCRLLLPPELRLFYCDRLDFQNKKDAERALSAFALINIDEFDSINKSQTAFLKHIQQKANIMGRDPYAMSYSDHKRNAVFMATTNSPSPLVDPTGSRRYLCIKTTDKIDNTTPIDYEQIYGQLANELFQGERSYFNDEEEAYIQEQNKDFQKEDMLEEIFSTLFERPRTESEGTWMSNTEIMKMMNKYSKAVEESQAVSVRIGLILKKLGHISKRFNTGVSYLVKVIK